MAARTVLVADEDLGTARLVARVLAGRAYAQAYQVFAATHGTEMWPLLDGLPPPALIVVELVLPGINGWEVIRRLRGRFHESITETPRDCRIIVVSARADEETVRFVRHLGADAFLRKPISPVSLTRVIDAALGGERSTGQRVARISA